MARSAATVAPSSPWASLPRDLVQRIAWCVLAGDLLGYVRFRAVCTSWRSGTVRPRGRGVTDQRFHPLRWTMTTKGHRPGQGKSVRFLNLDTGIFVRLKLPLLRNHRALDSVDGLLLLLRTDKDAAVRLLNPFTGDIAELPPLATLLTHTDEVDHPDFYQELDERSKWLNLTFNIRATVSCGNPAAGITTVMLAFPCLSRVAVATSNDRQWTMATWKFPLGVEPLSFRGSLYLLHSPTPTVSQIFRIDPRLKDHVVGSPQQPSPPKLVATCPPDILLHSHYLVDSDSEEILVVGSSNVSFSRILVYKLADLIIGRFNPVTSIGERALFIEERTTMCVSSNKTVMPETIVYTDQKCQRGYSGLYHLLTDTWSRPCIDGCELHGFDCPDSSSIIYHAMRCSMRNVWNKRRLTFSISSEYPKRGCLLWKVKRMFRHWC